MKMPLEKRSLTNNTRKVATVKNQDAKRNTVNVIKLDLNVEKNANVKAVLIVFKPNLTVINKTFINQAKKNERSKHENDHYFNFTFKMNSLNLLHLLGFNNFSFSFIFSKFLKDI
jgi:hypothetical protein